MLALAGIGIFWVGSGGHKTRFSLEGSKGGACDLLQSRAGGVSKSGWKFDFKFDVIFDLETEGGNCRGSVSQQFNYVVK